MSLRNNRAKTKHSTWEMHLGLQLIPLLFTSTETISVRVWELLLVFFNTFFLIQTPNWYWQKSSDCNWTSTTLICLWITNGTRKVDVATSTQVDKVDRIKKLNCRPSVSFSTHLVALSKCCTLTGQAESSFSSWAACRSHRAVSPADWHQSTAGTSAPQL